MIQSERKSLSRDKPEANQPILCCEAAFFDLRLGATRSSRRIFAANTILPFPETGAVISLHLRCHLILKCHPCTKPILQAIRHPELVEGSVQSAFLSGRLGHIHHSILQVFEEISPSGVDLTDEFLFLFPVPTFELLFAGDGFVRGRISFIEDEPVEVVAGDEALGIPFDSMLKNRPSRLLVTPM
ncbi:MAG TPA: hypothetical protein VGZ93_03340 [Candidatus Methylacidiphilales bacterium]|jgi:hypothetical protein|nr:hypothetical protein [Candidatus Methylacidiphilales bacterium]